MRRWRGLAASAIMAVVLAGLITLPIGDRRQISIELWLIVVSALLALSISRHLLRTVPVVPEPLRGIVTWRRPPPDKTARQPRNLLSLEGTLISGRDNQTAFAMRLRPRLKQVTDHYLDVEHGIDGERNPDRAAALLADSAWLVDLDVEDRTPTLAEIERLLDRILPLGPSDITESRGTGLD